MSLLEYYTVLAAQKPVMKKTLMTLLVLVSAVVNAQIDLNRLTPEQWQQDLDYMVNKIEKRFAGFNPELKTKFNKEAALLRLSIPSLTVNQRILGMAKLLAGLDDGHTELSLTGPGAGFRRFPLVLYYFGSDLKVTSAGSQFQNLIGMSVSKIENVNVNTIFEQLKPYVNKDNDVEYITTAPTFMTIPEILEDIGILQNTNEATFTLVGGAGEEVTVTIPSMSRKEYNSLPFTRAYKKPPMYLEDTEKGYWLRYLPDSKILYVNFITLFNQDGSMPIKKFVSHALSQIRELQPQKVVVDLRLCRGGNYHHIEPLVTGIKNQPSLNKKGRLFVINGRLTFSAAATATLFFKDQTNAIVVGETSRARPNWAENMESHDLPITKLKFDCTDKLAVHSPVLGDSHKIPVDVELTRSFDLYRSGRDEAMEYIQSQQE